jgi:hypothetical protein
MFEKCLAVEKNKSGGFVCRVESLRAAFEYCIVTTCFISIKKDAISRVAGTNIEVWSGHRFILILKLSKT